MQETILILLIILTLLLANIKYDVWRLSHRKSSGRRQIVVDTSALIDGRILSLAQTGFIGDEILIPRSVVAELQLLADGSDSEKRSRARFGLDVISELQKIEGLPVTILRDRMSTPEGVDNRLLELARDNGYLLLTLDYNLNKVAKIEDITVLNINELAQNIRVQLLPGETAKIKLTQPGSAADQAVGYLPDGTMVVVSDARKFLGKIVEIEATRTIQTEAGKMLFAKLTVDRSRPTHNNGATRSKKPIKRRSNRSQTNKKSASRPRQRKSK